MYCAQGAWTDGTVLAFVGGNGTGVTARAVDVPPVAAGHSTTVTVTFTPDGDCDAAYYRLVDSAGLRFGPRVRVALPDTPAQPAATGQAPSPPPVPPRTVAPVRLCAGVRMRVWMRACARAQRRRCVSNRCCGVLTAVGAGHGGTPAVCGRRRSVQMPRPQLSAAPPRATTGCSA